jgi:hypothetical protein
LTAALSFLGRFRLALKFSYFSTELPDCGGGIGLAQPARHMPSFGKRLWFGDVVQDDDEPRRRVRDKDLAI